ncbi:MAG: DUF2892 domain-containing protein [Vitreoscilla sp.]|jgi:hypothetical protein|nr:DUF2892 domain-containing protein [Vitreoscilla sp.]
MKCNVGNADKTIRIAVGLILIVLSLLGTIGWWGYLGIIPLLAGVVGNCPLYTLLGISTWKR